MNEIVQYQMEFYYNISSLCGLFVVISLLILLYSLQYLNQVKGAILVGVGILLLAFSSVGFVWSYQKFMLAKNAPEESVKKYQTDEGWLIR